MQTEFLSVDGDSIAVHSSAGAGPAALLIHGNSSAGRSFRKQIDGPLGAEYRLVAVDLPGHGASANASAPDRTYTLPGFAHVIAEVATQLDLADAVLVGWSLGGHIALESIPLLPNMAGVLIFGTPPLKFPPNMAEAFLPDPAMGVLFKEQLTEEEVRVRGAGWFRPGAALPEELLEDIRRSDGIFRTTFAASLGTVGYTDEVELVRNLRIPLAVIHGAEERVIDGAYIAGLAMPSLWRGSLQIIEGAGHIPQWEQPELFDAVLGAFLRATATAR